MSLCSTFLSRLHWPMQLVSPELPVSSLSSSIRFNDTVDVLDKDEGRVEAHKTKHDEECVRNDRHVPKVEAPLQPAIHGRALEEVEEGVGVDEEPRASSREEGAPPPAVVFARELEVHERDRDKARHDEQHDERDEQNPKQRVDLVPPHARKDVVELNVDGGKGQEPRHEHLRQGLAVPRDVFGDLPRGLRGAAGRGEVPRQVPPRDGADDREGKRDQHVERHDDHHRVPGEGGGGPAGPGHRVHPREDGRERGGKHERVEHRVPHPVLPVELAVQASPDKPANEARQSVDHNHGRQDRAPLGGAEKTRDGAEQQQKRGAAELPPRPHQGGKQARPVREAEHVSVDELPPALFFPHLVLLHVHVPREVVFQHPHEDDGEEGRQEEHEHQRVDDAEPVDLKAPG
mmetsp:Transcript_88810/g.177600  ORF Transcript_88810/g.177600 Transcript_88810/m.177600 type:complete len:403 (-) Transcript_88810:13-1221(-)